VISSGLLDYLRTVQNAFLPELASVSRYTETNGPDGIEQGWTTIASGLPCRVSSRTLSASEGIGGAEQERAIGDWRIWLEAFTDVTVRDRLVIGSRTFEVKRVEGESYETARACSCSEVT
jgi:head-tail adaptor